jgi:hypothetical protein
VEYEEGFKPELDPHHAPAPKRKQEAGEKTETAE